MLRAKRMHLGITGLILAHLQIHLTADGRRNRQGRQRKQKIPQQAGWQKQMQRMEAG